MKFVFIFLIILLLNNCSLNKDSKFWTEDVDKISEDQKKLPEVIKKSEDITSMTFEEYEIYIDDYTKKSKYPDIN
jgi:cell division protein FtsI/penicillin-binding protein 2